MKRFEKKKDFIPLES